MQRVSVTKKTVTVLTVNVAALWVIFFHHVKILWMVMQVLQKLQSVLHKRQFLLQIAVSLQ